jgi:hypothetical protein
MLRGMNTPRPLRYRPTNWLAEAEGIWAVLIRLAIVAAPFILFWLFVSATYVPPGS